MSDAHLLAEQRAKWGRLSAGWDKWSGIIVDQLAPVGLAMIDQLEITAGQHHLDIASGTGEPGLTIAKRAGDGHVVLTDLAPEMLEVAKRRADAHGIANIDTRVCSADDLPFDDAMFDSISVRLGYMFFPDTAKATQELVRVVKPGGRVCAAVWAATELNPWTAVVMDAIATEVVVTPPEPDAPNMYRCAAPGYVGELFTAAGLRDVVEVEVGVELRADSPEEYWEMISEHVSAAAAALQDVDDPTRSRIREQLIANVRPFERDGKVRVAGMTRCSVGMK